MIVLLLCLIPLLVGLAAFWIRPGPLLRALLPGTAVVHAALTALAWSQPMGTGTWIGLDPLGRWFLSITSLVFLAASCYGAAYLRDEPAGIHTDLGGEDSFSNAPESVFVACLLLFLASMTVVCVSRHLTLLWTAIEATTLASAPLIYFHRHRRSLEATWKYLLVCSVGIGLALLGNFVLVLASAAGDPGAETLWIDSARSAHGLDPHWLRLAFILLVVGYGTKMGLAPLHTWLPDTHSEAPSVVSALLSGALLNCAFLGILRAVQICAAAGQGAFAQQLLVGLGLLSMAVAALFLMKSRDTKRMLAYSSVEHMGILALGVGLGGVGVFASLFHALNHSLCKASMFMVAGNFLQAFRTRLIARLGGALHALPIAGTLWVAGFLALTGTPPFSPFVSELGVLRAGLAHGPWIAAAYLACLAVAFLGMARGVLSVALGPPVPAPPYDESLCKTMPPLLLLVLALALGVSVPGWLLEGLRQAAAVVGVP